MADPQEKAPSGIVFLVGRSPLDRAAALHRRRRCSVLQFPLPGRPSLSHEPGPFCPLRPLVKRIDLEMRLSPPAERSGLEQLSPLNAFRDRSDCWIGFDRCVDAQHDQQIQGRDPRGGLQREQADVDEVVEAHLHGSVVRTNRT